MPDFKKERYEAHWQKKQGYESFTPDKNRFICCVNLITGYNPGTILDMGCGSGYLAYLLKEKNPGIIIHGCDISRVALDSARCIEQKFQLDIDNENVPQQSEYYDVVACTQFLEHIYDVNHALREMHRILRRGGKAVISVPNYAFWRFRIQSLMGRIPNTILIEEHIRFFTIDFLKRKSEDAGFRVTKILGCRRTHLFLSAISKSFFSEWLIFEVTKP